VTNSLATCIKRDALSTRDSSGEAPWHRAAQLIFAHINKNTKMGCAGVARFMLAGCEEHRLTWYFYFGYLDYLRAQQFKSMIMEYILLQGIKLEDFLYQVEKTIEKKVNEKLDSLNSKPKITYLDSKKVAEMLGISVVTLWDYCKRGLLPSYRIGRKVRFRLDEVEAALLKRDFGRH